MIVTSRNQPPTLSRKRKRRTKLFVVQKTQYKYAMFMFRFGIGFGIFMAGVSLYLLNSNYFLFKSVLLIHAPKVIANLNTELKMANELIIGSLIAYGIFMALLGLRLSHRLVVPVFLIQEKIKGICRGDLKNANISVRKSDEFQEFCENYNYLVETMRSQLKTDLIRLESLKPDPHDRDAVHIWEKMVAEKKQQLDPNENSASLDPIDVLRHVS